MSSSIDLVYVKLAAQNALLDAVTPNLRAVYVDINNEKKEAAIHFYYDGKIDENTLEIASIAATNFSSNFPPDYIFKENFEKCDYLQPIIGTGYLVFERFEKR